jgi:hypothetical protein
MAADGSTSRRRPCRYAVIERIESEFHSEIENKNRYGTVLHSGGKIRS